MCFVGNEHISARTAEDLLNVRFNVKNISIPVFLALKKLVEQSYIQEFLVIPI